MGDKMVLTYIQNYLRFQRTFEAAKSFIEENGGELDKQGYLIGTPFKLENVDGKFRLVENGENGEIARDDRLSEVGESLRFMKEFPFFASDAKFWQKEGKISKSNYKVQRLDGDILNHTVQPDDIILVDSRSCGKWYGQNQLASGEKVITRLKEMFGTIPSDLFIMANLKPHMEIPELSRRFGLERADFWTVWKPQEPFNFFYKRYEHDDEKEKDVIVEARIEKGYAISYPWSLDWAYISVSDETFGVVRTKPMPFESWELVADDFKIPPKEILSAREVTKRLLNGEPWKNFENCGVNITKPKGVHPYGYRWHARGIDVPWEQLRWEADRGIPENCRNLGYSQSYYLISDEKEAFIVKSIEGVRFLEMPESDYGALVIGSSEQAVKFREEIRKEEEIMLSDDFTGYMLDKVIFDDFWYAIRVLPDGRYVVEEWSDSSTENDRWTFDSVDEAHHWILENNQDWVIGQEVNYWSMPGECIGSADSNHSLMNYKVRFDADNDRYYVICDDSSGKDTIFTLEYYGDAEEILAWLKTTSSLCEKAAEELERLIIYHQAEMNDQ